MKQNRTNRIPTAYRVQPADDKDLIAMAYSAGMLSKIGNLVVYGIGSNAATNWATAATIELVGVMHTRLLEASTWFTNVYNDAQRNKGKTNLKQCFYLTQLDEITPFLNWFGLTDIFNKEWERIQNFDAHWNLAEVVSELGHVPDWRNNTIRVDIPFVNHEMTIMDSVTSKIIKQYPEHLESMLDPFNTLACAFIEGMGGLTIGTNDWPILMNGNSLVSKHQPVNA